MKTYCYLRVSSPKRMKRQSTDSQRLSLDAYCRQKRIKPLWYEDYASGRSTKGRKGLASLLEALKPSDTVLVSDLSRFSRNLRDTLSLVAELTRKGVTLTCLNPAITFDQTAMSQFTLQLFAAISQLESAWKGERIRNGLDLARLKGKRLGNKPDLKKRQQVKLLRLTMPVSQIAKKFKQSPQGIYRLLAVG